MEHTNGPWAVKVWNYDKANPPRKEMVVQTAEKRIAVIDWDEEIDNPYTIENGEAIKNAAIIAAAPELLEALEIIMRHFDRSEVNASGEIVPANINRKFTAVDIARKAIAKARGL